MTDHITLPRSVVEQAIEALEDAQWIQEHHQDEEKRCDAIEALRAALAGAAQAELVYQYQRGDGSWIDQTEASHNYNVARGAATVRVLYTAPQPAQPVQEPHEWVRSVMEQAQVFASAWAIAGGRFDSGDGMQVAEKEKEALRAMLTAAPTPPAEAHKALFGAQT